MEINSLQTGILRNEEHYKFQLDVCALIDQFSAESLGIEALYPAYKKAVDAEASVLNIVRGSTLTEELYEADMLRDTTFSGLLGTIRSALNHFDPAMRASAQKLSLLFDAYGYLPNKPYDQETASIVQLVSELEDNYAADVSMLGLLSWVTELKNRNKTFDDLKNQRYSEQAVKPQQNLKQARYETDNFYRAIVKKINALIEVNGAQAYAGFVNELNQRIENFKRLLYQRKGRNAKEENKTAKQ